MYNPAHEPEMEEGAAPPRYDATGQAVNSGTMKPPSYTESSNIYSPDELPSYDSLFGELRQARNESHSMSDLCKKIVVILLGTIGCTIVIGIMCAIPISMIVIGSMYLNDCRGQRLIPIYLVVGGCFGLLKNISSLVQKVRNQANNDREANASSNPFDGLISCFLVAWFICGNVWVFGLTPDTIHVNSNDYCDPVCYYFAYYLIIAFYVLIGAICCLSCCVGICVSLMGSSSGGRDSADNAPPPTYE